MSTTGAVRRRLPQGGLLPHLERLLWSLGVRHVAGVDEVGMGPLAGPVVAAAVVLNPGAPIAGLADSKALSAGRRETLAAEIRRRARGVGVAAVGPAAIDRLDVRRAGFHAMRRALAALAPLRPGHVLVDGHEIPGLEAPQTAFPGGDGFVASIAAASIVAKVVRDGLMRRYDRRYPQYGFARHMGYPTPEHLRALRLHGPCPLHRRSFAPVRAVLA